MIRATQMLAHTVLADPRSRKAREALPSLDPPERRVQLCNLEVMEQIRQASREFRPVRMIAYAFADAVINGSSIIADGAAFQSDRRWYRAKYRCEVAGDMNRVVALEFAVGGAIPEREWEEHGLAAGEPAEEEEH
ncbi:MAG: DUF930 domain-containing protein [Hyphomicrobiales bacterium]|nr:DUF930 domain-containing protein [Hyphomicrobiales bacterium]